MVESRRVAVPQEEGDLVTRDQGKAWRSKVEALLGQPGPVEIDLGTGRTVSPSFADELFGKLLVMLGRDELRARVRLKCDDDVIRTLVQRVLAVRLGRMGARSRGG
jgi:hypothetical protein